MSNKGREDSVTDVFKFQVQDACRHYGMSDLIISLNGSDRDINADTLFGVCDRFFLVEMKSYKRNIRDESLKPAVCLLCKGLLNSQEIRQWHRACHFIMWGRLVKDSLDTRYTIYQDSVCRDSVLPGCRGLGCTPPPEIYTGKELARKAARGEAGLSKPDFFHYLYWLLNDRESYDFMIQKPSQLGFNLYGTSTANGHVISKTFKTYDDLEVWADDALRRVLILG
ncbi:Uncharacterised protein [Klebsiella quasipneumoniae]|uniref:hypothetical protein n=1 Tax=Klebsiella quasipneumoniae TaxID=1463165 RepID=UPI000A0F274B|nr:hypothetical protein [Klebsiella quasipneumoniae]SMG73070.1 Uncharacterised protein [Klebsiella quasipneumoniae]